MYAIDSYMRMFLYMNCSVSVSCASNSQPYLRSRIDFDCIRPLLHLHWGLSTTTV